MTFMIEDGEQASTAVKRIAHEQVEAALMQLRGEGISDRDIAIHEARKIFKQMRALLRLVRDSTGKETYQLENTCYRDAGRTFSTIRDSYVRIESLDRVIEGEDDASIREAAHEMRQHLSEEYNRVKDEFLSDNSPVSDVIATLEEAQARIDQWSIADEDFTAFAKGLKRTYKRGIAAMDDAYDDPLNVELFHEWRKRTKDLWYQMRILAPLWQTILEPYAEALHQLSDNLGQAHDFALLYDYLDQFEAYQSGGARHILALLDYKRARLEQESRSLGMRIFAEKPKRFIKRLNSYWAAWQVEQEAAE